MGLLKKLYRWMGGVQGLLLLGYAWAIFAIDFYLEPERKLRLLQRRKKGDDMKKILIIGAGPAGLTAAYNLLRDKNDCTVTILEKTDMIGGISRTVQVDGNRMDMGGHRFFSKMDEVTAWWENLLPTQGAPSLDDKLLGRTNELAQGGPDPEKEDRVMLVRNRVSRIYYQHKFFDYPVTMNAATIKNLGFFSLMKAGFSYLYSVVVKKPETSLENFYINRFGRVLYSMFFEGYTEKLWGRPPREISADWGAQRVKGLSIWAVIKDMFGKLFGTQKEVETSLIESFRYPKFGPGQLWEQAAADIIGMGGVIEKNCTVTHIATDGDKVTGVTYVQDGETHVLEGDYVLSTMPVKDLIAGMDNVPQQVSAVAKGLPYRDFVTVGLLVDKLAIQNKTLIPTLGNIVPDCWIYVQDTSVKLGRIQIFNNWSPYMVEQPENTVWMGLEYFCSEGDDFWTMPEADCIQMAIGELQKIGVIAKDAAILKTHLERVEKAYPAYFDTYAQFDTVKDYLNGYGNLFCMGRNGQHRYNNMDHSMATAFETVRSIETGTADKTAIWNVNTEQAYHEEKDEKGEKGENEETGKK